MILKISASQLDTSKTCLRKWYFSKILKMPYPFRRNLLLGTVGHEVVENYELGKEMYPTGWTSPTNRFTGLKESHHITTTEQALIKALVTKAVNEGVVRREPDGEVEKEFGKELGVIASVEDVDFKVTGFIDYFFGNEIQDHKFTSAARYYGNTALKKALPMNLYAWAGYEEGFLRDPTCWLTYNVFVKDLRKPAIKQNRVERSKEEVYDFFEREIVPLFKPMALAAKNVKDWEQCDNAMCQGRAAEACDKYGGCDFLDICLGKVTVDQYKSRIEGGNLENKKSSNKGVLDRLSNGRSTTTKEAKGHKENKMSGFLAQMSRKNKETDEGGAGSPLEEKAEDNCPPETVQLKAPWAFESCPVCANNPIKGVVGQEPCTICVSSTDAIKESTNEHQPVLADFEVIVQEHGGVAWCLKESETASVETSPLPDPIVSEHQSQKHQQFCKKEEVGAEVEAEVVKEEETSTLPGDVRGAVSVAGREGYVQERTGTKGFILSFVPINSRTRRSTKMGEANCTVLISELGELVGNLLLKEVNKGGASKACWQDVSAFTRRDLIQLNAKATAEMLGNSMLDCSDMLRSSDEHALATSLKRYASCIFGSFE